VSSAWAIGGEPSQKLRRMGARQRTLPSAIERTSAVHSSTSGQALNATSSGLATAGSTKPPAGGVSQRRLPVARSSACSLPARSDTSSVRPTRRACTSPLKLVWSASLNPHRRAPVSISRAVIRFPSSSTVTTEPASANTTRSPFGATQAMPWSLRRPVTKPGTSSRTTAAAIPATAYGARRVARPAAVKQATPIRNGSRPAPAIGRTMPRTRPAASRPRGSRRAVSRGSASA
jgi:hypothetical protein